MTTRTRLIYFVIDPYTELRTAVGALLQSGEVTELVRGTLPRLTPSARFAVARGLGDIEAQTDFDTLPIGAGPQFVMGEPRTLPLEIADAGRWVLDHLLRAA